MDGLTFCKMTKVMLIEGRTTLLLFLFYLERGYFSDEKLIDKS